MGDPNGSVDTWNQNGGGRHGGCCGGHHISNKIKLLWVGRSRIYGRSNATTKSYPYSGCMALFVIGFDAGLGSVIWGHVDKVGILIGLFPICNPHVSLSHMAFWMPWAVPHGMLSCLVMFWFVFFFIFLVNYLDGNQTFA